MPVDPAVRAVADQMHKSLLADLRLADKLLKAKVKKAARAAPAGSDACGAMLAGLEAAGGAFVGAEDWTKDEAVRATPVVAKLTVGFVMDTLNGLDRRTFVKYLLMLQALAVVGGISDDVARAAALDATLSAFKAVQDQDQSAGTAEAVRELTSPLGHEVLSAVLLQLVEAYQTVSDLGDLENLFDGTKIGALAKEISGSIDLSGMASVDASQPFDLNMLMGSNSPLTTIVSQVGSAIQNKIASGELKQEDLFAEALGLMRTLDLSKLAGTNMGAAGAPGGAGGMADMMGMLSGMMGAASPSPK